MKKIEGVYIEFTVDAGRYPSVREWMRKNLNAVYQTYMKKGIHLGTAGTRIDENKMMLTVPVIYVDPNNKDFESFYKQSETPSEPILEALPAILISPVVIKAIAIATAAIAASVFARNLGIAGARVVQSAGAVVRDVKSLLSPSVIAGAVAMTFILSGGLKLFKKQ